MGGASTPSRALLEGCTLEPTGFRSPWPWVTEIHRDPGNSCPPSGGWPKAQGLQCPLAPSVWGEYTREKARRWLHYLLFPGVVLPDGPPDARGPLEVLVGLFTDLYRLSWEIF